MLNGTPRPCMWEGREGERGRGEGGEKGKRGEGEEGGEGYKDSIHTMYVHVHFTSTDTHNNM